MEELTVVCFQMYKTQYIAPLRVKLDPSRSENSSINYMLVGNRFGFGVTLGWGTYKLLLAEVLKFYSLMHRDQRF